MGTEVEEIKVIEKEIKKTKKAIRKAVESHNEVSREVSREVSDRLKEYNAIPPDPLGAYKETKEILVDAMRGGGKDLDAYRHTVKALQSRLDTLKQSKENKLNKIVFREDLEGVGKLQKEAEELKQRKAELSAKYANPETQSKTQNTEGRPQDKPQTPGGTPANEPQNATKHQASVIPKEVKEIYYDGNKGVLFVGKTSEKLTPTEKTFFEYFWNQEESVGIDSVIDYMTTLSELNGTTWTRGYFDTMLSSINRKGESLGGKKLIRNVVRGEKEYKLFIKVKKKRFQIKT